MKNCNAIVKKIVTFRDWDCDVDTSEVYSSNRRQRVIQLILADTAHNRSADLDGSPGDPVAIASICIPGYPFNRNETAIKDYSENKGMLEVLQRAEIIEVTGQYVLNNLLIVPVVRILWP